MELAIRKIYKNKKDVIKLFSLASGSARAVIEVMGKLKKQGIIVEAKLLDLNQGALEKSKEIAIENDVLNSISLCRDKVSNFIEYCDGWRPDIIEMVGFLDYLNDEKALSLFKKIISTMTPGGFFITCNIKDNYERKFITKILNWDMIYRDEIDLAKLMLESGFLPSRCKIIYEPSLIHGLTMGEK